MTQNSEKLANVAIETLKSGIADFRVQFDHEGLVSDEQIPKQLMSMWDTIFSIHPPWHT